MTLVALPLIPLIAAGLIALARRRALIEIVHTLATLGTLALGITLAVRVE